jgi:hypothetical protein
MRAVYRSVVGFRGKGRAGGVVDRRGRLAFAVLNQDGYGKAGSMSVRKSVIAALGVAALSVIMAAPASADPKGGDIIELNCDALGTVEVVVFSNAPVSPGLVVGSTQVGIPYRLHVEGTFTPTEGEPESFVEDIEKPAPRNGRLDDCTFHQEGSDESGSFELEGEVSISYTPTR